MFPGSIFSCEKFIVAPRRAAAAAKRSNTVWVNSISFWFFNFTWHWHLKMDGLTDRFSLPFAISVSFISNVCFFYAMWFKRTTKNSFLTRKTIFKLSFFVFERSKVISSCDNVNTFRWQSSKCIYLSRIESIEIN